MRDREYTGPPQTAGDGETGMAETIDSKEQLAILRVLRDGGSSAVSSAHIARAIEAYGFDMSARTVRLHLQKMADLGLVADAKRGRGGGREITPRGLTELEDAAVLDRIGFTAAKVDRLAWEMGYDVTTGVGRVVLNVTLIKQAYLMQAVREMSAVFRAGLGMGQFAALIGEGEDADSLTVPEGYVGLGTVCSVTVNGVLLNARIPTISRFGAVLELRDAEPARFTDLIAYEGTTLDPLEMFIKARLTNVHDAAITGNGRIGASFREVPTSALPVVSDIRDALQRAGLGGVLLIGKPNQPLLDIPVHEGRTGLIVVGGLNPAAAVEEAGIGTENRALCTLCDVNRLIHYRDLAKAAADMGPRAPRNP